MLSRCLLTKFLYRSSVVSLLRVRCWSGGKETTPAAADATTTPCNSPENPSPLTCQQLTAVPSPCPPPLPCTILLLLMNDLLLRLLRLQLPTTSPSSPPPPPAAPTAAARWRPKPLSQLTADLNPVSAAVSEGDSDDWGIERRRGDGAEGGGGGIILPADPRALPEGYSWKEEKKAEKES